MFSGRKIIGVILAVGVILSLWFNYSYFHQQQEVREWQEITYNRFVGKLSSGARLLGFQTSWYNKEEASLEIGEAAMALYQWYTYSDQTGTETAPHVEEVANYLSYVASIFIDPDSQFEGDDVAGEKYVKNIMKVLDEETEKKGLIGDITEENEDEIFNKFYELIPKSKVQGIENRVEFFR